MRQWHTFYDSESRVFLLGDGDTPWRSPSRGTHWQAGVLWGIGGSWQHRGWKYQMFCSSSLCLEMNYDKHTLWRDLGHICPRSCHSVRAWQEWINRITFWRTRQRLMNKQDHVQVLLVVAWGDATKHMWIGDHVLHEISLSPTWTWTR